MHRLLTGTASAASAVSGSGANSGTSFSCSSSSSSSHRHRFIMRKCLLVLLVVVFTCASVHLRGKRNVGLQQFLETQETENAEVETSSNDGVSGASDDLLLSETQAQVLDVDRLKSYFEYDEISAADAPPSGISKSQEVAEEGDLASAAAAANEVDSKTANANDADDGGQVSFRIRRLQQTVDKASSKDSKDSKDSGKGNKNVSKVGNGKSQDAASGKKKTNTVGNKTATPNAPKAAVPTSKSPVLIKLIEPTTEVICSPPAYKEFPPDIFGDRARSAGAVIFHIAIILYMFYCLAIVCEDYFLPSLEQCCQRLNLSQDVAGATFMAAGSSAPELFTAILGVFIAKGDVGTGTIVGSAVFNILFVIGLCSLYTVSTELNWWPVARDTAYYTFTVFALIICIYDGEVSTYESFFMLLLYGVYILIMNNNIRLRDAVLHLWETHFPQFQQQFLNKATAGTGGLEGGGGGGLDELNNLKGAGGHGGSALQAVHHYQSFRGGNGDLEYGGEQPTLAETRNPFVVRMPEITIFEAANQVIVMHKRLFRGITRFRSAAYLVMIRSKKAKAKKDNFYSELNRAMSMDEARKMSRIGPDESFWRKVPDPNVDGFLYTAKWAVQAPLHAVLFYTIPDCKEKSHLFLVTFFASITWTAIFSYVMVWMVTLIGFTFGIPDSIMGITFLAAGTSVPDAYASLHVAKLGQADMAVSNSIGSNVFDILVGLALPWFVETAIVSPGAVSKINSRGLVYAVILLFLSLVITVYLFHRYRWTLCPSLGYALLSTYAAFLVFSSALEFNLFGYVNPPMCDK